MANANAILEIPADTGYWLVRADGGKYYEDFFLNNFIAVSDNEVTLENIRECIKEALAGITLDHYKKLYGEKYDKWNPQQIAHAAGRTYKFIEEIKIGDLILVPSKNSTQFSIGIIISEVYEISENELTLKTDVNYSINPFFKRRKVQWIKEVSRGEISEKLYWILSAHQTIFNLVEQKNYINQLLAPLYIQDGRCHGILRIGKEEGLSSEDWYDFYSLVKNESESSNEKVIIKSNVQSPGVIELITQITDLPTAISLMVTLSGILFTEVKFGETTIRGVIPYFVNLKLEKEKMKHENKKMEIDNWKVEKEIEILEEEKINKQLDNQRKSLEIEKEKLAHEAEQLRHRLQITSFDAGRIIENQTQTDSGDDLDAGVF